MRAILFLAALAAASPATAATVENCSLSPIVIGRMYPQEVKTRFARVSGGNVTIGSASRQRVVVQGCSASARYTLSLARGYVMTLTGHPSASITLLPFVVAVNGVALASPRAIAEAGNSITLEGQASLDIVLAADSSELESASIVGDYSGQTMATFTDVP